MECQETILLLGRQLQALRPPAEPVDSSPKSIHLMNDEDTPGFAGFHKIMNSVSEVESTPRIGAECSLDGYNTQVTPPDTETSSFPRSPINLKSQKHRSSGSSTSPNALHEKHGRGFSRFFSKGKSDN